MPRSTRQNGACARLAGLLIQPLQTSQGQHIDPVLAPAPDPDTWSADQRDAYLNGNIKRLRDCIATDSDCRSAILAELAEFHSEAVEAAYDKCINWEQLSVDEWSSADRSTPEGLQDFYDTLTSWKYDLAWYAYLQTTGYAFPQAVAVLRFLEDLQVSGNLLDFGSGIGVNAQFFRRSSFDVTIADISRPLLRYAAWRFQRHQDQIKIIDLNHSQLPDHSFDVVTAFDVLVHVRDFDATAVQLHRSIKPNGWLFANFDTRSADEATAWHLHNNKFDLDRRLKRAGFVRRHVIGGFLGCYQRVEPDTLPHRVRSGYELLVAPTLTVGSVARRVRWPTPARVSKLLRRVGRR
ncbi:class I SAM-dependent methyltransferase [Bradyrhizobium sp. HKCCYLS3077]|uniref:class I SAM-dependent methyltransferase n=1 Tax=Bradyrhizobium sp. HKCCYLS3077 TaxID=3420761 RepID=UPI003EBBE539